MNSLQQAFDVFNAALFGDALPPCLITLQRKNGAYGYFSPARFERRGAADATTDEIAMNPAHFARDDRAILGTLAHEMAHLWQEHYGEPGRGGYHNAEWGTMMDQIGLTPTSTGKPGGARTGQRVTHLIVPGGRFDRACAELLTTGLSLRWHSRELSVAGQRSTKSKTKFVCSGCGQNAWAKPTARLMCADCALVMEADDD
jgi:hypothetical protein